MSRRGKGSDPLRRRIADARKLLASRLEGPEGADGIEKSAHQLAVLEGLARARRRRRSLLWATGAVALTLLTALVLRFSPLDRVEVALVAKTRAFLFVSGDTTRNILPNGILLRELTASRPKVSWCADPAKPRAAECRPALALRLNTLNVYPRTTTAIRQTANSCFQVAVLDGGAQAIVSARLPANAGQAARDIPDWEAEIVDLHPGDAVRFCPDDGGALLCQGISSLMVGDRLGGGPAERENVPTLSKADLSVLTTAQSTAFLGTDILHLDGLANGVAAARLDDPIELSVVGEARRLTAETGSHRLGLMPNALDWVRGKPQLKAALTLLAAIFGVVVAVRERWLGELG